MTKNDPIKILLNKDSSMWINVFWRISPVKRSQAPTYQISDFWFDLLEKDICEGKKIAQTVIKLKDIMNDKTKRNAEHLLLYVSGQASN